MAQEPQLARAALVRVSRDMNQDCPYLDFFDNHDLWHFFSAASVFAAFVVQLTIDDNLLNTERNEIFIF